MTNEKNYEPVRLKCNGATKDFPFDFQVYKNSKTLKYNDLIVTLTDRETKEETILTENTDYVISTGAIGGNVATNVAYAENYDIEISRKTSHFQEKNFSTSSGFQASEVENSFDRVSCSLQDMDYNIETFKKEYSAETNKKIENFEIETTTKLEANKQELLTQVANNKADTDARIETNKKDTDTQIKANKQDTDNQISTLTKNLNDTVSDFTSDINSTVAQNKAEIETEIKTFESNVNSKIEDITTSANSTKALAQNAVTVANQANTKSDNAVLSADNAVSVANTASTIANEASNTASNALTKANTAVATANEAKDIAENTTTIANSASSTANIASAKVDDFEKSITDVLSASEKINEMEGSVEEAKEAANSATSAATTANNAAMKATAAAENAVSALENKQDIIPDLTTIREGASLGATALQSFTETDPVYTADKPTLALKKELPTKVSELENDSNYVNKSTFNVYLKTKQDVLTAGDNIEIEDNIISAKSSAVIGEIISVACSSDYVPVGALPTDSAEYTKAQFPVLWENYLTSENYEIEETYNSDITFSESCTRNNGVISNFENGGFTFTIPYKNVGTAEIHFTTGSDVITPQIIANAFADKPELFIYNGKLYYSGTGFSRAVEGYADTIDGEICDIEANTEYYIKLILDNGCCSCYLYKKENNELVGTLFVEINTSFENQTYGHYNYGEDYYFKGSFDLTKSYYPDENGKLIYLCTLKTLYKTLLKTCTYDEYTTELETYGQCAKFAVDLENETFRVPYKEAPKRVLVKPYSNGTSWYNLFSDGWCEQGGQIARTAAKQSITLLQPYKDTDYSIFMQPYHTTASADGRPVLSFEGTDGKTTESFTYNSYTGYAGCYWRTRGYTDKIYTPAEKYFVVVGN